MLDIVTHEQHPGRSSSNLHAHGRAVLDPVLGDHEQSDPPLVGPFDQVGIVRPLIGACPPEQWIDNGPGQIG